MDTETVMCPVCNIAMVNGVCPQCGMKAEDMQKPEMDAAPAEETTEAPAEEAPAEEAQA